MHFDELKHHFHLHFIILIFGFTGILGELITLDAIPLVWYRVTIAVAVFILISFWKFPGMYRIPWTLLLKLLGIGGIIALHWITFFHAIKISTVSLTLACLAASPFFASLLEPLFFRRKIYLTEMVLGLMTIIGIAIIFQVDGINKAGIYTALSSGFLAATFSTLNGKLVHKTSSIFISFWELVGASLFTTVFILSTSSISVIQVDLPATQWIYILILAVVCTNYAATVAVHVMKFLSPFTVVLSINMEPVYGIVMAVLFFGNAEMMNFNFYVGAFIIMSAVFVNVFLKQRRTKLLKKHS